MFDRVPGWCVGNPLGEGFELMAVEGLGVVHGEAFDNETLCLDGVGWKRLWAPGVISVASEVSSLSHSKSAAKQRFTDPTITKVDLIV